MEKELESLLEDLDSGEEVKTKYGVCYAYSPDTVEKLKQALAELKAIKEAKPSEALKLLEHIIHSNNLEWMPEIIRESVKRDLGIAEQYILKAQEQEQKSDRVEKLTQLLFKDRRKVGQEYIKWCEKNNTVFDDATNMVTWALCIKLKEVLNNE